MLSEPAPYPKCRRTGLSLQLHIIVELGATKHFSKDDEMLLGLLLFGESLGTTKAEHGFSCACVQRALTCMASYSSYHV